jgi:hypothetical protein
VTYVRNRARLRELLLFAGRPSPPTAPASATSPSSPTVTTIVGPVPTAGLSVRTAASTWAHAPPLPVAPLARSSIAVTTATPAACVRHLFPPRTRHAAVARRTGHVVVGPHGRSPLGGREHAAHQWQVRFYQRCRSGGGREGQVQGVRRDTESGWGERRRGRPRLQRMQSQTVRKPLRRCDPWHTREGRRRQPLQRPPQQRLEGVRMRPARQRQVVRHRQQHTLLSVGLGTAAPTTCS